MNDQPLASVIVRAKNEGRNIGRALSLLDAQTVRERLEVIVVDSGSQDDTVAIARAAGARIIEIPPESFTFGGSLNTGCRGGAHRPVGARLSRRSHVGRAHGRAVRR